MNNPYAITTIKNDYSQDVKLLFFSTKETMEDYLKYLSEKQTRLGQSYLYFTNVFKKNPLLPTEQEEFWKERNARGYDCYLPMADFFIQRTLKNGKIKSKHYTVAEDFDWQLDEWKEKGSTDIYILDERHSYPGDYYYDREILQKWGTKHEPLID